MEILELEPVKRLTALMRSDAFHEEIMQLPGYIPKDMGLIRTIPQMFQSAE
jgi:hypothetical protein